MFTRFQTMPRVSAEPDVTQSLVGTWKGENRTITPQHGYHVQGEKTVVITDQQDRRFRGHFTYRAGAKISAVRSTLTTFLSRVWRLTARDTTTAPHSVEITGAC